MMDPGLMTDEHHPRPAPQGPAPARPLVSVVPEGWLTARLRRRRVRRAAEGHGRHGVPAVGARTPSSTPTVDVLDVACTAATTAVLDGAVARALPLRLRRAALLQTLRHLEHQVSAACAARELLAAPPDGPARERRRGEGHLTEVEVAARAARERAAAHRAAAAEVQNLLALRHWRHVDLQQVEERLDDVAAAAQAQAALVRCGALHRLHEYRDALVRRHPDGKLLNDLAWPAVFAEAPAWVDDAGTAQVLICGRARGAVDGLG